MLPHAVLLNTEITVSVPLVRAQVSAVIIPPVPHTRYQRPGEEILNDSHVLVYPSGLADVVSPAMSVVLLGMTFIAAEH